MYMSKLSAWVHKHKKIEHQDFYTLGFDYDRRYKLYEYIIQKENLNTEIDYLEFGVCKGLSFRWWMEHITNENAHFYGFDTFTGLPEDWGPFKKGDMSNNNEPPKIDGTRHHFYQGLFQQTVPVFLKTYNSNRRKVFHMDADLYSSTLFTLASFNEHIKAGDIILFDEFNVPLHEFKAFEEWIAAFYREYEVLGGANNFYATAIKITR